jgi:hypothetical protein
LQTKPRPRAERNLERTSPWYDALTATIEAANNASSAVSNRAWMNDRFIAKMVQVRRFAWQVRDRYGIQCSALRPNVNASKPLDESQQQTVAQLQGIVAAGWSGLDEALAGAGVSADLVTMAKEARGKTDAASRQMAELVKGFDGSGRPAMSAQDWNVLC